MHQRRSLASHACMRRVGTSAAVPGVRVRRVGCMPIGVPVQELTRQTPADHRNTAVSGIPDRGPSLAPPSPAHGHRHRHSHSHRAGWTERTGDSQHVVSVPTRTGITCPPAPSRIRAGAGNPAWPGAITERLQEILSQDSDKTPSSDNTIQRSFSRCFWAPISSFPDFLHRTYSHRYPQETRDISQPREDAW